MGEYISAYEMEKADEKQSKLGATVIIQWFFIIVVDWLINFAKRLFHMQESK